MFSSNERRQNAVTRDGHRDILGLWAGDGGEGAKYWLHVLTELKNRGTGDVLMIVCDGLPGLPDAIATVWPQTITQTCIVHLLRNSFRYAGRQHWDAIAKALRPVYTAPTEAAAMERFLEFRALVDRQHLPGQPVPTGGTTSPTPAVLAAGCGPGSRGPGFDPGALTDQMRAARHLAAQATSARIGQPHRRQEVRRQQLRKDPCVDLVGLDLRLGDHPGLGRVRHDHPSHQRFHMHFDHANNVGAFPNADVYVQRDEYHGWLEALSLPDLYTSLGEESWITSSFDRDDARVFGELARDHRLRFVDDQEEHPLP